MKKYFLLTFLLFTLIVQAQTAGVKIRDLPNATSINNSDFIMLDQGGNVTYYKTTLSGLKTFISGTFLSDNNTFTGTNTFTGSFYATGQSNFSGQVTFQQNTYFTRPATFSSTILGSITGNAGTVTNGLYSTDRWSNPLWLTSLDGSKILSNSLLGSSIANSTITLGKFDPSVLSFILANGGVGTGGTITDGSITTSKYADQSVTNAKLAGDMTPEKLAFNGDGNIIIGNGQDHTNEWGALNGDVTMSGLGTTTIGAGKVKLSQLSPSLQSTIASISVAQASSGRVQFGSWGGVADSIVAVCYAGITASSIVVASAVGWPVNINDRLGVQCYDGYFVIFRTSGGTDGLFVNWILIR
jgi:hypothetical protein